MAAVRVTGGCLCGAVRLTATGRPYRVGLCHCLDCRKHHGAPFHAFYLSGGGGHDLGRDEQLSRAGVLPRCGSSVLGGSGD